MPGALLQLSAISEEESYLTINPQVSYFKSVYYNYHNFAKIMYNISLEHTSNSFLEKQVYKVKLPKYGDLIKEFYIKVNLPAIYCDSEKFYDVKWDNNFHFKLIDNIKFSIGGRTIQEFNSDFLYLYYQLSLNSEKKDILKQITGQIYTQKYKPGQIFNNNNEYTTRNINGVNINYLNKHFESGNTINQFETIIPIPVWFTTLPFPISNLEYMDINVEITFNPINELILVRDLNSIEEILINKVDPYQRPIEDKAILDCFLKPKSVTLIDYRGKFFTDVYTIDDNVQRVSIQTIDYNDFNIDGKKYPDENKIITLTNCYRKQVQYFISKDSLFRKAKFYFKVVSGKIEPLLDKTKYILDSGYGYSVPNIEVYPKAFRSNNNIEYQPNSTEFYENYRFSRNAILNSDLNNSLKNILLDIFPKIIIEHPNGGTTAEIIVSELDLYGRITLLEFKKDGNGDNLVGSGYSEDITDKSSLSYSVTEYEAINMKIFFNLYNKSYKLSETIYKDRVTDHIFTENTKFANLINIEISTKGIYYATKPKIFIYGRQANFEADLKINTDEGTLHSVNFNNITPLGFKTVPELEIFSENGRNGKVSASLGVYSGWWYYNGMFYSTKDEFRNGQENVNEKNVVGIENIGKPILNLVSPIGFGAIVDLIITDDGIGSWELFKGSGYTMNDEIQFDYAKSDTNGKRATIRKFTISDTVIENYTLSGGTDYIDDTINGLSNTINLDYSHLNERINLDYSNIVLETIDRGIGEYCIEFIDNFSSINGLNYNTNSVEGSGFSINASLINNCVDAFEICIDSANLEIFGNNQIYDLRFNEIDLNNIFLKKNVVDGEDIKDNLLKIETITLKSGVIAEFQITNRGCGYSKLLNIFAIQNISDNIIIDNNNCNLVPVLSDNLINEFDILYGGSNYKVNDIVKFCSKLNPGNNIADYISEYKVKSIKNKVLTKFFELDPTIQYSFSPDNMKIYNAYLTNLNTWNISDESIPNFLICDAIFKTGVLYKLEISHSHDKTGPTNIGRIFHLIEHSSSAGNSIIGNGGIVQLNRISDNDMGKTLIFTILKGGSGYSNNGNSNSIYRLYNNDDINTTNSTNPEYYQFTNTELTLINTLNSNYNQESCKGFPETLFFKYFNSYNDLGYPLNKLNIPPDDTYDTLLVNHTYTNISVISNSTGLNGKISILTNNLGRINSITITNRGNNYKIGDVIKLSKMDFNISNDISITLDKDSVSDYFALVNENNKNQKVIFRFNNIVNGVIDKLENGIQSGKDYNVNYMYQSVQHISANLNISNYIDIDNNQILETLKNKVNNLIIQPTQVVGNAIMNIEFTGSKNFNINTEYKILQFSNDGLNEVVPTKYAKIKIKKIYNNAIDTLKLCNPGKDYNIGDIYNIYHNNEYKLQNIKILSLIDGFNIDNFYYGSKYNIGDEITITNELSQTAKIKVKTVLNKGIVKSITLNPKGLNFKIGDQVYIRQNNNISASITVTNVLGGNIESIAIANKGVDFKIGDRLFLTGGDNNAYITVTGLKNGVLSDVNIVNSGNNYYGNIDYLIENENLGSGIVLKITNQKTLGSNGLINNCIISDVEILNSGENYNKYNPNIVISNHPDDNKGFGAVMSLDIKEGIISKIYAKDKMDRGFNYQYQPSMSIYGSKIFIAEITEFDSNGGIKKIVVKDSMIWPSNLDVNIKIHVNGPGNGAELKPILNFEKKIVDIEIVKRGQGYNSNTIEVVKIDTPSDSYGVLFNVTVNKNTTVNVNIVNSGKNYKIGNTFRIIGGKKNNLNLTYITVTNVGHQGEILSINLQNGYGYYSNTTLSISDDYFFFPEAILGINEIDIIEKGIEYIDEPKLKKVNNQTGEITIYDNSDVNIKISDRSIFGYLTIINKNSMFTYSNLDDFKIFSKNGSGLKLEYIKSVDTVEVKNTDVDSNILFKLNTIINLKFKSNLLVKFKVTQLDNTQNIDGIELGSVVDLSLIEGTQTNLFNSNLLGNNQEISFSQDIAIESDFKIELDNIPPKFKLFTNNIGNCYKIEIMDYGRNIINTPQYINYFDETGRNIAELGSVWNSLDNFNINENIVLPENPNCISCPPLQKINIGILLDLTDNKIKSIFLYLAKGTLNPLPGNLTAKGYSKEPTIIINNKHSNNVNNNAVLYTKIIEKDIVNNKEFYITEIISLSGSGYRNKPNFYIEPPSQDFPNSKNAVINVNILGKIEFIKIIDGGSGYNDNETPLWNSSEYPDLKLNFIISNGKITNIYVLSSNYNYTNSPDIVIYKSPNNIDSLSPKIEIIMNYSVSSIELEDGGFGYMTSNENYKIGEFYYLPIEFDSPVRDEFNQENTIITSAFAVAKIVDCSITEIIPLLGNFSSTGTGNPVLDTDISINIINNPLETNDISDTEIDTELISYGINWIKFNNNYHISSIDVLSGKNYNTNRFYLDNEIFYNSGIRNYYYDNENNFKTIGTDNIYVQGTNLLLSSFVTDPISVCSADNYNPGSNYDINEPIYIVSKTFFNSTLSDDIDYYENNNALYATLKINNIESNSIYRIDVINPNLQFYNDSQYYVAYNNNDEIVTLEENTNNKFKINNRGSNYFNKPVIGYRGGGLFEENVNMELGKAEILYRGNNYEIDKPPIFQMQNQLNLEKGYHYKPFYISNNFNLNLDSNGFFVDDLNKNNNFDGDEDSNSQINIFNQWFNQNKSNSIVDTYTQYTETIGDNCLSNYIINDVNFVNDFRGNFFYTKPLIKHTGNYIFTYVTDIIKIKYRKALVSEIEELTKTKNIDIFPQIMMNYIYLDEIEKKNIIAQNHQFIVESYNLSKIDNPAKKTYLLELFGSTKDLIIVCEKNSNNQAFNYSNFDDFTKDNYLEMQNYIVKICIDQFNYNSRVLSDNNQDLIALLGYFVNDEKKDDIIIPDYIFTEFYKQIRSQYNDDSIIIKLKPEETITSNDISTLREIWSTRNIENIPYINSNYNKNIINSIALKFNKMYRLEDKTSDYFKLIELSKCYKTTNNNEILLYSFALDTNNWKPNGFCNFSYINKFEIKIDLDKDIDENYTLSLYNRYYNILQVESGMANLLFFK